MGGRSVQENFAPGIEAWLDDASPHQRRSILALAQAFRIPPLRADPLMFDGDELSIEHALIQVVSEERLLEIEALNWLVWPLKSREKLADIIAMCKREDAPDTSTHYLIDHGPEPDWSPTDGTHFALAVGDPNEPVGFLSGKRMVAVSLGSDTDGLTVTYHLKPDMIYVRKRSRGQFHSHALTLALVRIANADLTGLARQMRAGPHAAVLAADLSGTVVTQGGQAAIDHLMSELDDLLKERGGPDVARNEHYRGYAGCTDSTE